MMNSEDKKICALNYKALEVKISYKQASIILRLKKLLFYSIMIINFF